MTVIESPTSESPARRRRDAEENRAALLTAAGAVLNRDPDASLDAIAAEAGLSRRAVYGHFATRDELVRSLLAHGASRVLTAVDEITHPEPLVRLALIGVRLWREVEAVRVMAQFAVRGPHQHEIAAALEPLRHRVRATVDDGVSDGSVRTDIPSALLARLIEGAALTVLDEAARTRIDGPTGQRLVALSVLAIAGLDAATADALVARTPELRA